MDHRIYWLWLTRIPGIGQKKIYILLLKFTTPYQVFCANHDALAACMAHPIFDKTDLSGITSSRDLRAIHNYERRLKDLEIGYVTIEDPSYPQSLLSIYDPPYVLYYRGILKSHKLSIGMVGSRRCTAYGRKVAEYFGGRLAENGVNIVSGLARGIDGYSHQGALAVDGFTTGVLGCGINVCYPKEHLELMKKIIRTGCVISEYGLDVPPKPGLFPMRNRIISGLSHGVLLVEAREKSGSLITIDFALEYGKDIFAVPGDVLGTSNKGSNNIVKLGGKPVFEVDDILEEYSIFSTNKHTISLEVEKTLDEKEKIVYSCISLTPVFIDELSRIVNLTMNELQFLLTKLEMKGAVTQLPNKYYIRDHT
jgi:DNA processing protein